MIVVVNQYRRNFALLSCPLGDSSSLMVGMLGVGSRSYVRRFTGEGAEINRLLRTAQAGCWPAVAVVVVQHRVWVDSVEVTEET